MKKHTCVIAITGGIGSGKSKVIERLKNLGLKTLSCDVITREMYDVPKVKRWLIKQFPEAVVGKIFKRVDKSLVAKTVFADKEKLQALTKFLTPIVLQECLKRAKRLKGFVFVEVPLLFECDKAYSFDKVIVITRELESRIKAVTERSNLSREQVLERINSQFDYSSADLSEYTVISNDGTIDELNEKINDVIKNL